ncbi:MAG: hypothetical protein LBK82_12710 [Planctomycetaceae bacterium]|jgi:hypothetical protein|nr:hypothetical protein [Planctomycetaceae bacterium]
MSNAKPKKIKPKNAKPKSIFLAVVILSIVIVCYVFSTMQRNYRTYEAKSNSLLIFPKSVKFGGEILPGEVFRNMETARFERDRDLIAEIKKVIAQKETPSEIFKNDLSGKVNIAPTLNNMFRLDNSEELQTLRDAASKEAEWNISSETLEQLSEILDRFEEKRLTIRNALNRSNTCFYFLFEQDEEFGEIVDVQAADYLEDYLLLEEYTIAKALRDGRIEDALDSLVYIFRIAQLTSEIAVPAVRSSAALIRLRAVDVMQTIVLDPKFNKRYLNGLYEMLREQLEYWTPDRAVWVADRASGLKTYHRILQYGPEAALTPAEIDDLEKRDLLMFVVRKQKKRKKEKNNTTANDNNNTDNNEIKETILLKNDFLHTHVADEIFYLKSMQKVIDECPKPYYQRLAVLNEINNEVLDRMDKKPEPVIAEILLRGIVQSMRLHAQDRAGCEIAFLAMSISLGKQTVTSLTTNPFSEEKYGINEMEDTENPENKFIQVSSPDNRQPFRVPDYRTK